MRNFVVEIGVAIGAPEELRETAQDSTGVHERS
jgi:hypothetical protein